jgi:hypothetical protein
VGEPRAAEREKEEERKKTRGKRLKRRCKRGRVLRFGIHTGSKGKKIAKEQVLNGINL